MPRITRPTDIPGELRILNEALHELHEQAGLPSLKDMERMVGSGVASRSRIHEAFSQPRLPSWGLVELLVEQLVGRVPNGPTADEERLRFHGLWIAASKRDPQQPRRVEGRRPQPTQDSLAGKVMQSPALLGAKGNMVTALAFTRMGWIYAEQSLDAGIDGMARAVDGQGRISGRIIATVVKCGSAYFRERLSGQIVLRETPDRVTFWLDHLIPVIVVLVDPASEVAYWVHVSEASITRDGDLWRLEVPDDQILDGSSAEDLNALTAQRR